MTARVATSALVVGGLTFARVATAVAGPCGPGVIVEGDPAVTSAIREELEQRSLTAPAAGCPAERVTVELHDGGFVVRIVDQDGREFERRVTDAATVVTLIESFMAQAELAMPRPTELLRPREVPDREEPRDLAGAAHGSSPHGTVGVTLESSLSGDGALWLGFHGKTCVRIGAVCIGVTARYARDSVVAGDAERTESTRTAADVLITTDLPLARARWVFTPGVGAGIGWLHSARTLADAEGTDMLEIDAGGVRLDAHLETSVAVWRGARLVLGAAIGFTPNAHTASFSDEGMDVAGEPRTFGRVQVGMELAR